MRTASNSIRRARPLLGTFVEIAVADAALPAMHAAINAAFAVVRQVHELMSFHEEGSDVSRVNREAWARPVRVHAWTFQVLQTAIELHQRSAGAFDIAVAPVLQAMGLLPLALGDQLPSSDVRASSEAIALLPGRRVRFRHPDTRIDLGGVAKGFAVDRAVDALREHGIAAALVNAGGDLATFGPRAHAIHIRDPRAPDCLLCRLNVISGALASSAGGFDPFVSSHPKGPAIIDPRRRKPPRAILAATVRAPSCILADALTKVVMVVGRSAAPILEHYRAGALVLLADGRVQMTCDFESATCLAA